MSYRQIAAVRLQQVQGGPLTRLVLWVMADHACELCGLAWPGVPLLERETQVGVTRIRQALEELVAGGLLRIHAYPTGGRGRSTEYVVFPALPDLVAPPCLKCRANLKPSRNGGPPANL